MTLKELTAALKAINERSSVDEERDHVDADNLLCEYLKSFGPLGTEAAAAFDAIGKWYS
jgi:hypothetical protein